MGAFVGVLFETDNVAAFVESNPLPVKAAMALLGKIENSLRLPLLPLSEAHTETVRSALRAAGALR